MLHLGIDSNIASKNILIIYLKLIFPSIWDVWEKKFNTNQITQKIHSFLSTGLEIENRF